MKDNNSSINTILATSQDDNAVIIEVNKLLSKMSWSEKLELHGHLSTISLKRIYNLLDKIAITNDVREHILWFYYKKVLQEASEIISDEVLYRIIGDYKKYRFGALESNILDMLQNHRFSREQLVCIENAFYTKTIKKHICILKVKGYIESGNLLSKKQVEELIVVEAYKFVEHLIDDNCLEFDALKEFKKPEPGEKHRRIKESIYNKINKA